MTRLMTKTAIAIRHVAFEDLGVFERVLNEHGYSVRYLDAGIDSLAEAADTDLLFVLGGPITATDQSRYPWLRHEVQLIANRIECDLPVFGICLGAQLIARALGARVYPGAAKEIGFAPLSLTSEGKTSALAPLAEGPVLHWHGDTFDLPAGAVRHASTDLCFNQAFELGSKVMACQFHPEAGDERFERWLIGHHGELVDEGIDIAQLRAQAASERAGLAKRARQVLSNWLNGLER